MVRGWIVTLTAAAALSAQSMPLAEILSRVSEEAEVFRRVAPQTLAEETLNQRSLKGPSRFRPRVGAAASAQPKVEYATREIISEYSFATLKEGPGGLHEFRQVVSVDGKKIRTPEKARHALSLGLQSDDDRARKRMLEDFRKVGLIDAVMDFGQILLLFTKRELHNYDFRIVGEERIGADTAIVLKYDQRQGDQSMLVFEGKKTIRQKMDGKLWVRGSDGLPLRISMRTEWKEGEHIRVHEAAVEYTPTPFGIVAPASVKHTEYRDKEVVTENVFRYSPFHKFGADAEIKFDAAPVGQGAK